MRPNKISLKQAVAMLAATCTLGTCCIAGSVAWAVDSPSATPAQGENTANIKTGQNTSITIYKYEGPETKDRNNGKAYKSIPDKQKPISGVKFKITRVVKENGDALDLSVAQSWKDIEGLIQTGKTATEELAAKNLKLSTVKTDQYEETTGTDGKAEFTKLGQNLSLYYVEEDLAASKPMRDGKPVKVTKQVNPFFVTVPLPDTQTHTWLYDLKIYPKNDVNENKVEKKAQADPSQLFIAGKDDKTKTTMGWDISIPLTAIKDGGTAYNNVSFTDPINTDFLNYSSVKDVRVVSKPGKQSKTESEDLTAGTDYTVEAYSSIGESPTKVDLTQSGVDLSTVKWIRVKLTATGLGKASAKVGGKLTATVVTTVINPGQIKNYVNTDVDGVATGDGNNTPGCVPTKDKPCTTDPDEHEGGDTTNFAKLTIDKYGLSDDTAYSGKPLKGAIFKVYKAVDGKNVEDFKDKTVETAGNDLVKDADKVRTMAATDDKGKASDSFFVGNADKVSHVYCVVETTAPAGFNLDKTLHCVDLNAGAADTANTLKIDNKKATGMDQILSALPMTGARGLVILTLCGIVGIAGTLFYIVLKRRKEQEQE